MVVYNSLIADLAPECLHVLEGTATEKLVSLQLKLEKEYPNAVVQCVDSNGAEVIQVKGDWNDIKGIHMLLEKLVTSTSLTSVISIKPHDSLFVKTEPDLTGFIEDENYVQSNDDFPEEDVDKVIAEEIITKKRPKQRQKKKKTKRKTSKPRKAVKIKVEPAVNDVKNEEHGDADDYFVVGKVFTPRKKTSAVVYNDSDTEDLASEDNDEEAEKDDSNYTPSSQTRVTVKIRKRRYKAGQSNLIEPENIDTVLQECMEKIENDDGSLLRRDIPCTLCDYKGAQKGLLRVHLLRCHGVHKKCCPICNAAFGLNKDLNSHMRNAHEPKIPCPQCKCKFIRQTALDRHIEQSHGENASKKPTPTRVTPQKKEDQQALFKCDQCNYITEVRRYLKHHFLRNHGEREFPCSVCNKRFGLEKDLRQHMKNHTDVNCVQCEECGKTLRSKFALQLHINSIHRGIKNTYKKEYVCDHCGKLCANKTVYNDHINKDHLNIKRFGCPLCPMSFFTKYNLRHHLVTHSTEKNYSCETCGKDFKRRSSLRIHQRIHETVRQYTCTTCNKSFHQQGAMKRHERIHTGEKPYKCSICNAAFTDYSILRRHLMGIHKQDKASSRVYLRKQQSIEGINRGGEKKDVLLIDDISKYRGVFRGVKEHVDIPEDELIQRIGRESGEGEQSVNDSDLPTMEHVSSSAHNNKHTVAAVTSVCVAPTTTNALVTTTPHHIPEEDYRLIMKSDYITNSGEASLDGTGSGSVDGANGNHAHQIDSNNGDGGRYKEESTSSSHQQQQPQHIQRSHSSMESEYSNSAVEYHNNIRHESLSARVTPLPHQITPAHTPIPQAGSGMHHPEQSVTPLPPPATMIIHDPRHLASMVGIEAANGAATDESGRPVASGVHGPAQINFSNLPISLPEGVFNPMWQYSHAQRPDLYATAGAILQAAQQQQQQHKYDGHGIPDYYYNSPL